MLFVQPFQMINRTFHSINRSLPDDRYRCGFKVLAASLFRWMHLFCIVRCTWVCLFTFHCCLFWLHCHDYDDDDGHRKHCSSSDLCALAVLHQIRRVHVHFAPHCGTYNTSAPTGYNSPRRKLHANTRANGVLGFVRLQSNCTHCVCVCINYIIVKTFGEDVGVEVGASFGRVGFKVSLDLCVFNNRNVLVAMYSKVVLVLMMNVCVICVYVFLWQVMYYI